MILLIVLALLFVKNFLVDFIFQTQDELDNKAKFLDWRGLKHSLKHGFCTSVIIFAIFGSFGWWFLICGLFDFLCHYIIDYVKYNYRDKKGYTPSNEKFCG